MVQTIKFQDSLEKDFLFIDVRSEKEFEEDHIISAVNMPVLNNEERHMIGYMYKQINQDEAIKEAYKILDKKLNKFEDFLKLANKKIIFYCFRGGLRSKSIAEHFSNKGFDVLQLEGGHKEYRAYIRKELENIQIKNLFVLHGYTGAGKTKIINKIPNSIDLEGLANHRGSNFGSVGLKRISQKMFETLLFNELKKKRDYLIVEGESRKIGDIFLPSKLYELMQNSNNIFVESDIDCRARRIFEEYFESEKKIQEINILLQKMIKKLGHKKIKEYEKLLIEKKHFEFSKMFLLEYYDPLYEHTIKEMNFSFKTNSDDINFASKEIINFCKKSIK